MHISTAILHDRAGGSEPTPRISQCSAFAAESAERMEAVFRSAAPGFVYTRIGNPTIAEFERRIAAAERGAGAVACASGMAAVSMALLNVVESGDEIVATSRLYGGSLSLMHDLRRLGVGVRFARGCEPADIERELTPRTKVVFGEVISNPALDVMDVRAVADAVHGRGLPLFVDATTVTPALMNPLAHGADVVIHSASKYINGFANAIGGVIVDGASFKWDAARWPALAAYADAPRFAFTRRLRDDTWQHFGPCIAPMNAWLNTLGLETLSLRMERECTNARALAEALAGIDGIHGVNYPTLGGGVRAERVARQMAGGLGGAILTFRTGSKERAFRLINALECAEIVSNIGDVRTLVLHPASTIFMHSDAAEREAAGVYDDLVRVSVGIEDIGDLVADFRRAAAKMG